MARRCVISAAEWILLPSAAILGISVAKTMGGFVLLTAERGEPARFGRKELATVARESSARVLFWLLSPFRRGPTISAIAREGTTPVLLLPGLHDREAVFTFLMTYLAQRGFPVLWPVRLPRRDLSLSEYAAEFAQQVEELCRRTGAERIDIVAHSTGGLVAAWYVRHLNGAARVRRLVTLATPWRGTRTAVFLRGRLALDLRYESPLLDGLAPPAVPTLAVFSPDDPFVVPSTSAAPNGAHLVRIEGAGHVEMLVSSRVFRAVHAALTNPLTEASS